MVGKDNLYYRVIDSFKLFFLVDAFVLFVFSITEMALIAIGLMLNIPQTLAPEFFASMASFLVLSLTMCVYSSKESNAVRIFINIMFAVCLIVSAFVLGTNIMANTLELIPIAAVGLILVIIHFFEFNSTASKRHMDIFRAFRNNKYWATSADTDSVFDLDTPLEGEN